MRITTLIREAAWAGCMFLGLLIIASASFVGSWLLRFEWFSSLFRIPNESVLIPFWVAALTAPVVACSAAVFWLGSLLVPGVVHQRADFLLAHIVCLSLVLAAAFLIVGQPPFITGPLATLLLLGPRLLFRRLTPRGKGGLGAA